MARELSVDLEVNPILNTQGAKNLISTLEKELRAVHSGQHLGTAKKASSVMRYLMESGIATTPTQARMIATDMMGGAFSPQQKAVLRTAQNLTSAQLFAEKTSVYQRSRNQGLMARAAMLKEQAEAFKASPTSDGQTNLIGGIVGLRRELLKLYQEYRVNRRQVPQILRQIAQNTSGLKKEISDWKTEEPVEGHAGLDVSQMIKSAVKTAGTLLGLNKIKEGFLTVLERGNQALKMEAAYGREVSWRDARTRAALFNMPVETALAPGMYASDFTQRMMWGEISEREIVGLSRAGRWGRMVMSGEAARNPEEANRAFEEMVATTDQAKMRSVLRQLGLSQDLMNYNIQAYTGATREEYERKFGTLAAAEAEIAKVFYDVGNQLELFKQELQSVSGLVGVAGASMLSPQARETARRLGVNVVTEGEVVSVRDKGKDYMLRNISGLGSLYDMDKMILETLQQDRNVNQNINNNITINGSVEKENIDDFANRIGEATAKAMYNAQVNSTPYLRSGF